MKPSNFFPSKRTHVAIMRKSWGLTKKILSGEKTIESRWYKNRYRPWDQIGVGETIYFKDSGGPITIKAEVSKVLQFSNLNPLKVQELLDKYGQADGLGTKSQELKQYFAMFKDKKYCIMVFLKDVQEIAPFNIDKAGFGSQAAWLIVDNIERIKK